MMTGFKAALLNGRETVAFQQFYQRICFSKAGITLIKTVNFPTGGFSQYGSVLFNPANSPEFLYFI
jgi:hypothetical protein